MKEAEKLQEIINKYRDGLIDHDSALRSSMCVMGGPDNVEWQKSPPNIVRQQSSDAMDAVVTALRDGRVSRLWCLCHLCDAMFRGITPQE